MTKIKDEYCACCGQKIKVYKRSLRKALIDALFDLNKKGPSNWRELNWWVTDIKVLKFWDFIIDVWDDKIMITEYWENFLFWKTKVSKFKRIFNNEQEDYKMWEVVEQISISDVLDVTINKETVLKESRKKEFKNTQVLRLLCTEYWKIIWIENLYDKMKPVWKIKNWKELKEEVIDRLIDSYRTWLFTNGLWVLCTKAEKGRYEKLYKIQ